MHGLLRCNIKAGVHARGRSGRVTQRCHNSPDGNGARECRRRHAPEARGGFGGFRKSQLSWVENETPNEKGRLSGLAEARRFCSLRAPHKMEGRLKSQNRKNVYLSPYVEEPLNSKVITSFEPELRSCKYFTCFGIPMFYVNMLWTFYVRFT